MFFSDPGIRSRHAVVNSNDDDSLPSSLTRLDQGDPEEEGERVVGPVGGAGLVAHILDEPEVLHGVGVAVRGGGRAVHDLARAGHRQEVLGPLERHPLLAALQQPQQQLLQPLQPLPPLALPPVAEGVVGVVLELLPLRVATLDQEVLQLLRGMGGEEERNKSGS